MPGLQTVYQLQVADLERADVRRRLREAEQGLGETEDLRRARENLQSAEAHLAQLRTHVRSLELDLQDLTSKINAAEQRLYSGEIRNPKELEDLQADLRYLRSRRESLEDGILNDLTASDEGEARLARAQAAWDAMHRDWDACQSRAQAQVADLSAQAARLDERIAQLRAALPAPLLAQYDDLCRKKGGRGIAAIRRGLCEGCRVSVPTSMVQQVRRSEDTMHCTSCGRILCVVE